jgi:NAD(P)H-hydrate epimerase
MSIPYPAGEPLTCQQIRELDILTIEHVGIPGLVLMENAGRAAAEFIYGTLIHPARSRVLILCGPGNNGGDGLVIARVLRNAGATVFVVLATPAVTGCEAVRGLAGRVDVIVDALLGTGSSGAPRGTTADLVRIANEAAGVRRVAIDIPSGLDADRGLVFDPCFQADATVTFVAPKTGFGSSAARGVLGRVVVAEIGMPRELIPGRQGTAESP